MASKNRRTTPSVKAQFLKEPYKFEFHQAIKLLEYLYPKATPFGETINPLDEVVTVKSRVFLESMASDVYSLENLDKALPSHIQGPPILNVNFMGIAGIQGPLPYPYTEAIIQRVRNDDQSLKDFLDIFNHRLISILHRIRKQYLISLNTVTPERTVIAQGLKAFLGIGQETLQDRLAVSDRALLDFTGLYWSHPRSAQGLEQILRSYFQIPLRIEKCVGRWHPIEPDHQTRIGTQGQWNILGQGAALGTRAWDQQNHFRIFLGPLDDRKLSFFLPNGEGYKRLKDLTKLYVGPSMDFTVTYAVTHPPSTELSQESYLGWKAWLGSLRLSGEYPTVNEPL